MAAVVAFAVPVLSLHSNVGAAYGRFGRGCGKADDRIVNSFFLCR